MSGFVPDFRAIESSVVEDFDGSSLRMFKDCHRGERCFILGNGPSLQDTELAPLADEVTFGANGIFYMTRQCGFTPTYYVVEDNLVFEDNLARVNSVEAVARFFPSKYRPIIEPRPDTYFLPTDWSFYWGSSKWYETPRFSHDISTVIYVGQTVTFMSIQLAAYMGFKQIYLVGVDYEYAIPEGALVDGLTVTSLDDDPNHFHPDYFGKGKKWHLPKLENVGKAMDCARTATKEVGAEILNATIGGKLETFPRSDYRDLLHRPVLQQANSPIHYLIARSLQRAVHLGAVTAAVDESIHDSSIHDVVLASPLKLVAVDEADLVIAAHQVKDASDSARVLVLGSVVPSMGDERHANEQWFFEFLIDRLIKRRAAFWTRSVLELSPDGESVLVPSLGLSAQRAVDPQRDIGIDGIGNVDDSRATYWASGLSLSVEKIAEFASEVLRHDLSLGVINGYVYVQSRWKATEQPKELLSLKRGDDTGRGITAELRS